MKQGNKHGLGTKYLFFLSFLCPFLGHYFVFSLL